MPQRYFGQVASIVVRQGLSLEMWISLPRKGGGKGVLSFEF
jgi:hypothetical protein